VEIKPAFVRTSLHSCQSLKQILFFQLFSNSCLTVNLNIKQTVNFKCNSLSLEISISASINYETFLV
jgi:hypothetical protein